MALSSARQFCILFLALTVLFSVADASLVHRLRVLLAPKHSSDIHQPIHLSSIPLTLYDSTGAATRVRASLELEPKMLFRGFRSFSGDCECPSTVDGRLHRVSMIPSRTVYSVNLAIVACPFCGWISVVDGSNPLPEIAKSVCSNIYSFELYIRCLQQSNTLESVKAPPDQGIAHLLASAHMQDAVVNFGFFDSKAPAKCRYPLPPSDSPLSNGSGLLLHNNETYGLGFFSKFGRFLRSRWKPKASFGPGDWFDNIERDLNDVFE